jgi:hypothetical protein
VGGERWQRKGVGGSIQYKYCVHMYVKAKLIPVQTIPGMEGRRDKRGGWGEFEYDIFDVL